MGPVDVLARLTTIYMNLVAGFSLTAKLLLEDLMADVIQEREGREDDQARAVNRISVDTDPDGHGATC